MGSPNYQIFERSGSFILPQALNFIVDVFGGGGSGGGGYTGGSASASSGGGGGARNRQFFTALTLQPGTNCPVVVGAGGAAVISPGSHVGGNTGGKSSFGSPALGIFVEAYGGAGGSGDGAGGGGIASAGSGRIGGNPTISGNGLSGSINANASSDYGGAHGWSHGLTSPGNAVWGGGGAGASNQGGGSIFSAGGGGGYQQNAGASGQYAPGGSWSSSPKNGILRALQGGGGWGGRGANSPGANGVDGGLPGGGGGGVDGTVGAVTGKGGDGLVIIYWW